MNSQFAMVGSSTAALTLQALVTILRGNNTPPASRQISAPRGVTRFWGYEKAVAVVIGAVS
ncbi:MAG: hypothetical protein VR73_13450 [Gammaproteobacteria bacterium BRH_c0]|nr:MAG: hypothetical protein VR73_13450 [Gammaproteobacteria bacterium BRH_c0]